MMINKDVNKMDENLVIETERLILRRWNIEDVDALVDGLNNLNVSKWMSHTPYPYTKEDALDWLKIIKTAFILSDTNKQDLDYNNFNSNFKFEDISQSNDVYSRTSSINESYSTDSENFEDYPFNRSIFDNSSSESSIFNSSIGISDSDNSNLNNEESSFESKSDDGFIYNERYEGNNFLDTDNDDFDIIDIKSREDSVDDLDDIFDSKLKKEDSDRDTISGINIDAKSDVGDK